MPTTETDDEPVQCRVCGKLIAPGEARYRDGRGDAHVACHEEEERPRPQPGADQTRTE
jgi:hypothetical protein